MPYPCLKAQRCTTSSTSVSDAVPIFSHSLLASLMVMTAYQKPCVTVVRLNAHTPPSKMTRASSLDGFMIYFLSISKICESHIHSHCLVPHIFARNTTRLSALIFLEPSVPPAQICMLRGERLSVINGSVE